MNNLSIIRNRIILNKLPSKVYLSNLNLNKVIKMSDKELLDSVTKEKLKLSKLKKRVRTIRGDLKKKYDIIVFQTDILKKEMESINFSKPTQQNLKKAIDIKDKLKNLAIRSENAKFKAYTDIDEIVSKINSIEKNIIFLESQRNWRLIKK